MISFETTNSIFILTDENSSFSISAAGHWIPEDSEEIVDKLNELLELRSQNDFELHVKEVEKRATRTKVQNNGYNSTGFDHFKSEKLAELRRVKYKDLEDMVYRMELTSEEIVVILDVKKLLD